MAKTQPTPEQLPQQGGSYLLDPETGKWVLQGQTVEPETVTTNDDGSN